MGQEDSGCEESAEKEKQLGGFSEESIQGLSLSRSQRHDQARS